ncbi:MAG: Mth938-like domain-containing protein [Burkholderiales bacterium]|nr:Mth938-like domain-containing protein [Burkholderiales bacterium]
MKLHSTATQQYQTVTAYDADSVEFNAKTYQHSLMVLPEIAPVDWPVRRFEQLSAAHFAQIAGYSPDVVILGTGSKQQFVHPRLVQQLTSLRIGVECMDNQAACRTYNILMAEGRKVALALIMETA